MVIEKGVVLTIGDDHALFLEDEAFYKFDIDEDQDFMLGRDTNLSSSGFYIQISYTKFLPHEKDTPFSSYETCFTIPTTITTTPPETTNCCCLGLVNGDDANNNNNNNNNHGAMILKKALSFERLPKHVAQDMENRVENFVERLNKERNSRVLVPVMINIVATLFSPEVNHLYQPWKTKILKTHDATTTGY